MTVKKMSKILTFILVLAMVLSTVAMAEVGDPVTTPTYTITAGTFTNGSISLTLVGNDGKDTSLGSITVTNGKIENIEKDSKVKVVFVPSPGYEFVGAKDNNGKTIKDGDVLTITDNITITPVFREKQSLGGEKTVDSFRLDAICNGYSNWQAYHKDTTNNKKYTKYPGSPKDNVTPSSEITKGNYVDLTLYVTDGDF